MRSNSAIPAILVTVIAVAAFYAIVTSSLPIYLKIILAVALLAANGFAYIKFLRWEGWAGFTMVRIRQGVVLIDALTHKLGARWHTVCDVGLVFCFGFLAKPAFKHISLRTFGLSMLMLLLYVMLLFPYFSVILLTMVQIPDLQGGMGVQSSSTSGFIWFVVLLLFGFAGMVIAGLLSTAFSILASIAKSLLGDSTALALAKPTVWPVIPAITLPFVEGVIALLVLMTVHEVGHGIAARLGRIRIKSTGLLTFGFIPVGAFCDVDEPQLEAADKTTKSRVAIAGSASNFVTTFLAFLAFIVLYSFLPVFLDDKVVLYSVAKNISMIGPNLTIGSQIISMNGIEMKNVSSFAAIRDTLKPNSTVNITTTAGATSAQTNSAGQLGIVVTQPFKKEWGWANFLFVTLGLIVLLNFLIGVVNLLPLPSFDGQRLFKVALKNESAVRILTWAVLLLFLINLLPWLWQ